MNSERIKEIQEETAYPESRSVQQALLKVWNETAQGLQTPPALRDESVECLQVFHDMLESIIRQSTENEMISRMKPRMDQTKKIIKQLKELSS